MLGIVLGAFDNLHIQENGMPKQKRVKTNYRGVYYIEGKSVANDRPERIYYIYYRKGHKQIEEKAGKQFQDDMTPAKAARIRAKRIEGDEPSNRGRRELHDSEQVKKDLTINDLYENFIKYKSHLKSLAQDKIRYNLHLKEALGRKTIEQINSFEVEEIRLSLMKSHKPATVKQVLVLLKRIVNFGVSQNLCPPLYIKVTMPKLNNEKTEDLSPAQLSKLLEVLDNCPDKQAANIMKMALYTGMRRSELFGLNGHTLILIMAL